MNRFDTQMSLFVSSPGKGAHEWEAFNAVRHDNVGMFRVRQPEQASRYFMTTIKRPVRPQSLFLKPKMQ